jgi:hypothetical protein
MWADALIALRGFVEQLFKARIGDPFVGIVIFVK